MSIISLIAAVDRQYALGKDNHLLCHLPADLKYFKTLTLGKPVIMGHKTFLSIGKPLPHRRNIVLSRTTSLITGVEVMPSLSAALTATSHTSEVMIIGGANVYIQALHYATTIYLTIIDHVFDADIYFPILDPQLWSCVHQTYHPANIDNNYAMTFCKFARY